MKNQNYMIKSLLIILILALIPITIPVKTNGVSAAVEELLRKANEELGMNYYTTVTSKGAINESLALSANPVFVYGSAEDSSQTSMWNRGNQTDYYNGTEWRCSGFGVEGNPFPNEKFGSIGTVGAPEDYLTIEEILNVGSRMAVFGTAHVNFRGHYVWRGTITTLFPTEPGLNFQHCFDGYTGEQTGDWYKERFIVIQPSTSVCGGYAVGFRVVKTGQYQHTQYLADDQCWGIAYNILFLPPTQGTGNLVAAETDYVSNRKSGDSVSLRAEVFSGYSTSTENVAYRWSITGASFDGGGESGYCNIPANDWISVNSPSFTMGSATVTISFEINPDRNNPSDELDFDDNKITYEIARKTEITRAASTADYLLDYNIISRAESFDMGAEARVSLTLPRGSWYGNMTGSLDFMNSSNGIVIQKNRDGSLYNWVSDPTGTISLNSANNARRYSINISDSTYSVTPRIQTVINRGNIGSRDFPLEDTGTPKIWQKSFGSTGTTTGTVTAGGSVSRRYRYTYLAGRDADGNPIYRTAIGSTSASFPDITVSKSVRVNVYNGDSTVKSNKAINKRSQDIANSRVGLDGDYISGFWWLSDTIDLKALRLMYNLNSAGTHSAPVHVPVRDAADATDSRPISRQFSDQNYAEVAWRGIGALSSSYAPDRESVRNRRPSDSPDKAVFASDKTYSDVDWPIRSGYKFNPAGTFSFDVKSVQYKTGNNATDEHNNLVNAVIDAFRYESNIVYINNAKEAVGISNGNNAIPARSGSSYPPTLDYIDITAYNAPKGTDNSASIDTGFISVKVDTDYHNRVVTELRHSIPASYSAETNTSVTDTRLQAHLEGYSNNIDSAPYENNYSFDTGDSFDEKLYREYVHDSVKIYRVEETTTVTITINPENRNIYTHVQMSDGNYRVRAYVDNYVLSGLPEGISLTGGRINVLDEMNVKVVGSMYDDIA